MRRTFFVTVGTSLITNASRKGQNIERFLLDELPVNASAEMNPLAKLDIKNNEQIVFFHSGTSDGQIAAGALVNHFGRERAEAIEIAEIEGESGNKMRSGLRNLMIALQNRSQSIPMGDKLVVVANGGFKPMIAIATAFALLKQAPVYYVHEAMNELVEIPPIPIAVDTQPFSWYGDIFSRLADGMELEEYTRLVAAYGVDASSRIEGFLESAAGFVILSPLALAAWYDHIGKIDRAEPLQLKVSAQGKKHWEKLDETSRTEFRRIVQEAAKDERRGETKNNSDCRHFPMGRTAGGRRLVYYREGEHIVIVGIYNTHDDRDTDLDKNMHWIKDNPPVGSLEI